MIIIMKVYTFWSFFFFYLFMAHTYNDGLNFELLNYYAVTQIFYFFQQILDILLCSTSNILFFFQQVIAVGKRVLNYSFTVFYFYIPYCPYCMVFDTPNPLGGGCIVWLGRESLVCEAGVASGTLQSHSEL